MRKGALRGGRGQFVDLDNAAVEKAFRKLPPDDIREGLIHSIQKNVEVDEPEEDNMALLMAGKEWGETVPAEAMEEAEGMEVFGPGEEGAESEDALSNAPGDAPSPEDDRP